MLQIANCRFYTNLIPFLNKNLRYTFHELFVRDRGLTYAYFLYENVVQRKRKV